MTPSYAGIGSRSSPPIILDLMRRFGAYAALEGYSLNTGGADGSDRAFESGARLGLPAAQLLIEGFCQPTLSVFLPWSGFNDYSATLPGVMCVVDDATVPLVHEYHPNGTRLKAATMKLMRRNCHQVLGADLQTPIKFVVCWTSDGATTGPDTSPTTGGTGFAIRLAWAMGIPVFNLANEQHFQRISTWVGELELKWAERGVEFDFT